MVKVRLPRLDNTAHFLYQVSMFIKATAMIESIIGNMGYIIIIFRRKIMRLTKF